MALNPYGIPSDDSDVFDEEEETSESTTQDGPYMAEAMPREMQEAIGRITHDNHSHTSEEAYPVEFRGMSMLLEALNHTMYGKESTAYVLAAAEILDELSDGRYSQRVELHLAENTLRTSHFTKRWIEYLRRLVSSIIVDLGDEANYFHELGTYLDTMEDFADFKIEESLNSYRDMCGRLGVEIDPNVVEHGVPTYVSKAASMILGGVALDEEI